MWNAKTYSLTLQNNHTGNKSSLDNMLLTISSLLQRGLAYLILTSFRIVFAGLIELRRWVSIKPTLVQRRVFNGSISRSFIKFK